MITNNRHKQALIRADQHLAEALKALDASMPLDMVSIDIRNAWEAMGEITEKALQRIWWTEYLRILFGKVGESWSFWQELMIL